MEIVLKGFFKFRYLDIVGCWFWKGAQYISSNQSAEMALVSTNSICQGIQVDILWPKILNIGINIKFAYQSFPWRNSAKDNAGVHVVIIGLSPKVSLKKYLYKNIDKQWHKENVQNINPYLINGPNTIVAARRTPLGKAMMMTAGSNPVRCNQLFLDRNEKDSLIEQCPEAKKWIKKLMGADEFMNSKERYCLWLHGISEEELEAMPKVKLRVEQVRQSRLSSKDPGIRKLAERPHEFRDITNPDSYILVPQTTSERRKYVPVDFKGGDTISTCKNNIIPNGTLYEAGLIMSSMHLDWMRVVAGRMKSDYAYTASLVYNTFPWPDISNEKRTHIEVLTEEVLLVREDHPDKTLAQLYDPNKMPQPLLDAHKALDRAVEQLYRDRPFRDASERLEHLFARYEKLIAAEQSKAPAKKTTKGSK